MRSPLLLGATLGAMGLEWSTLAASLYSLKPGKGAPFITHHAIEPDYLLPNGTNGAAMQFLFIDNTTKPEPINVILTAGSFPTVPVADNATVALLQRNGLAQYLRALNYGDECLGLHLSTPAYADVGDGRGRRKLDFLYREDFGDPEGGTCRQTVLGGSHFRGWSQLVAADKPYAWFLAASNEQNLTLHHDIVPDGYDAGREEVVRRAQKGGRDPNTGCNYAPAEVWNETGVAAAAAGDANHYNHGIATDGVVRVIRAPQPTNCSLT